MQVRTILTAALCLLLPAAADAQEREERQAVHVITRASSGWLGLVYDGGTRERPLVVDSVLDGSPAAQSGLQKADTITAVNGLRATQQLMRSLGLRPGDEVRLTVRGQAGERTLTLVAAERPDGYAAAGGWTIMVDPERILESVRMRMDSLNLPDIVVHTASDSAGRVMMIRRHGGAVDTMHFHYPDLRANAARVAEAGRRIRILGDSVRILGDSVRFHADSLRPARLDNALRMLHILSDSAAHWFSPGGRFHIVADSFAVVDGDTVRYGSIGNTLFRATSVAHLGRRAVAGMELEELGPRLGEYFGTESGLLILDVADATPAARAGLQEGDVIIRADGEQLNRIAQLRQIVQRSREQDIRLQVMRQRNELTRTLRLER